MRTRVRHDDPSVSTYEGSVVHRGATKRPAVTVPATADLPIGDVVRVVLDASTLFVRFEAQGDETVVIPGVYETPDAVRSPGDAVNQLVSWIDERELSPGRTVHFDVVADGFRYGLRGPGETAIYEGGTPESSLSDIAKDL